MSQYRIVWAVSIAACVGAETLCAADKPSLHLSGSADLLWRVAETGEPASETSRLHFAWWRPGEPAFQRPAEVDPVRGVVDRVTARGEWLHLLYADGSHWRCTRQRLQPAANLPDRAKPLAWAASSDGAMLYALVPGRVLAAVVATQPTTTRAATSQPSDPLTRALQGRRRARGLVKFARQKWRRAEEMPLPPWADDPAKFLMAADPDAVHLFYRRGGDDLMYARWNVAPEPAEPAAPRWSEPVSTGLRPSSVAAAMVVNKRLLFVFAEPVPDEPGRVTLRIARPAAPTWKADRVLHVDQTDQTFDEASVVVTSVAQTIAVAQEIGDGEVEVSVWEPATGARRGNPRTDPIAAPGGTTIGNEMANWLLLATVSLLFVLAIRRRQLSRPRRDKSD